MEAVAVPDDADEETDSAFDTDLSEVSGMSAENVTLFLGSLIEAAPSESDRSLLVGETT